MTDTEYMQKALKEAQKAYLKDEVPIGACLVNPINNKIIAKAHNQTEYGQDVTSHAEILVLRKACKKLKAKRLWGLDLYVTLEPCTMCAAAISFARIRRVIYGATDPKGGAIDSGVKFFQSQTCHHKPEVISGVLEDKCSTLLKSFFKNKR
jgi:tRNA(Arg) A34 adenosine deaminase TadA